MRLLIPIIPALGRLRQENGLGFKASLDYIVNFKLAYSKNGIRTGRKIKQNNNDRI